MTDQQTRFREVWESLEPEITEDLERMYHRLETIKREAQLYGVRNITIQKMMHERFWTLWKRIGKSERSEPA